MYVRPGKLITKLYDCKILMNASETLLEEENPLVN